MATEAELRKQLEQAKAAAAQAAEARRAASEKLEWYKKNAARINERALTLLAAEWSKDGSKDGARIIQDFREQAAELLRSEGQEATAKARAAAAAKEPQQA